jgi:hypothetical protein
MIDILAASAEILTEAGFTTAPVSVNDRNALVFEDATVVGFLFAYGNPRELIGVWDKDASRAISDHQFGLRRAGQKAWNVYVVLVAAEPSDYADAAALAAIEEDLTGTRKIARAGIGDSSDLRAALLPLLSIQAAPRLEAVDIATEIRQRATELPLRAVDAFLSAAEEGVVMQVLEEAS